MNNEHHRRLDLVVQNTSNLVVVTNRSREIVWVNPAYTKTTGWTLDEVKGRNPRSFLHGPKTSSVAANRLGELLRKGQAVAAFEMLNYTKAGSTYWVSLDIQPILDEQGSVSEYVAIQTDITERKRRELEVARVLRQLGEAQRIAGLGSLEHDLASGVVHCSREVSRILDSTEDEFDTDYEGLLACVHHDDIAAVRQRYEVTINHQVPYESDFRVLSRTGRVKWVHMRGVLEGWDDGTPATCRMVIQDITERKQAAQVAYEKRLLEQASKVQLDVLVRVNHELRTPLHAVLGFAEIIEQREAATLSDRSKVHLRNIRDSSQRLLRIVNDILDLTRAQGGRLSFEMRPVDLCAAGREVVSMLEPLAVARGLTLDLATPAIPVFALADPRRLHQVLINIVGNALKYNRPGGSVCVGVKVGEGDGGALGFAIRDTGIGIAPIHLGRIFEAFYRVARDEVGGKRGEGTGLGLSIARSLARGMGGDIVVQSVVGVGSTFSVVFQPVGSTGEPPADASRRPASSGEGHEP